ncbi:hypothetical protein Acsp02_97840 [Actinoplanes sp. NBRC 103695]|nr:hypothetical protein Acsp02_97840 [Actinoplanes sp. NBRC 103695]
MVLVVPGELDRLRWDVAGQEVGQQRREAERVDRLGCGAQVGEGPPAVLSYHCPRAW